MNVAVKADGGERLMTWIMQNGRWSLLAATSRHRPFWIKALNLIFAARA